MTSNAATEPISSPEPQDFAGLDGVALVSGGSGGLGAAIAEMLARRGSDVAITWRSRRDAAEATAEQVREAGRTCTTWQLDACDIEAASTVVEEAAASGGIHTFVHAIGPIIPQVHLSRVDAAFLREQMDTEISSFLNVAQPALAHLRESKGSIVALTTAATRRYPVRDGLSPAAKGAVEQLVRGIAAEEGRFGIRANCVGPGMTTAGMAQELTASGDLSEKDFSAAMANIPLRSFGSAADVAEAVCFLASSRAGYISGQHIAVDGGYGV